jgi:SAM-dependent methyltransferase
VRHVVPVPAGTTAEELLARFRTWSVNGEEPGHLDVYLDDSFERFLFTCFLVPDAPGRALELGANPYFTTHLVDEFTQHELELVNFYGDEGRGTECDETVAWSDPDGNRHTRTYRSHLLNVEEDRLPFEDERFDVVLFCEVIEHLLMDPLHVLHEVNRVLKPDGVIVLTTPNVARLTNVLALLNGANLYDPYSGYGPYGRHNREYTRHELHLLLGFAGFDVDISFTADGHEEDISDIPLYDEALPLVRFRSPDLGHYLFARGRKVGPPREGRPAFLYRSLAEGEVVA